jgi:hypothetical protein
MATVDIRYHIPDEKAKDFVDTVLDTAATNADYIFWQLEIDNKKHVSIPVEFSWTYDGFNEVSGIGNGSMDICGDGMGCECDPEEEEE